jgi:hypothetical protein
MGRLSGSQVEEEIMTMLEGLVQWTKQYSVRQGMCYEFLD